jgi:hypothetical protein
MLRIENHGPLIISTNYWELPDARAAKLLVSLNDRTFRVLVPQSLESAIPDMMTGRECLVSRGPWPAMRLPDAFEILFDDRTSDPFALHLSPGSFDIVPSDEWIAIPVVLTVWTSPRRGRPHKALERPCWYRRCPQIPYLKPRELP